MWDYDGDEWDAEIENLASAWRNEDCIDATVDRESLTPQECAILDHVAWRVANFVWNGSTSKRLSKEEAEAIKYQKDALPGAKRKVAQAIQTLRRWKKETEPLNAKEISECPPHVKRVLSTAKTRNIAGIKRLVERLDFDDEHLGKDVKSGFPDFRPNHLQHLRAEGDPENGQPRTSAGLLLRGNGQGAPEAGQTRL